MEEWKEVEGYTSYDVSSTGVVRERSNGRIMPQTVNGGFWCTNLYSDHGISTLCKVHRLVAIAFIPNPDSLHNVDHKEDRLNNDIGNLQWRLRKVKEVKPPKEEMKVEHLGIDYTLTDFASFCGYNKETIKLRLRSGWSTLECKIGFKQFSGEGYTYNGYWYPTKAEYQKQLTLDEEFKKLKLKEERNIENAIKRAAKKAQVHHGFGIFVNYPIKGIEGRRVYRIYYVWQGIIARCYNPDHDSYERYGGRGCTVSEKWKHFQDFAIWYQEQQKRGIGNAHVNWHVDKDILVDGNLEYGPDTCCFVPDDVNIFFAGITDTVKGYTEHKDKWTAGVSTFGVKHQRCFDTEEDARVWYLKGKTQSAQFLIWKYEGLLEQRVIDKLSQI